jgi:hypothetical protein
MSGLPPSRQLNANDTDIDGYTAPPEGPYENIADCGRWTRSFLTRSAFGWRSVPAGRWCCAWCCRRACGSPRSASGWGVALALALNGGLQSLLFGVSPFDAPTIVGVVGLVGLVSLIGCYLPARVATCVDPLIALRDE